MQTFPQKPLAGALQHMPSCKLTATPRSVNPFLRFSAPLVPRRETASRTGIGWLPTKKVRPLIASTPIKSILCSHLHCK